MHASAALTVVLGIFAEVDSYPHFVKPIFYAIHALFGAWNSISHRSNPTPEFGECSSHFQLHTSFVVHLNAIHSVLSLSLLCLVRIYLCTTILCVRSKHWQSRWFLILEAKLRTYSVSPMQTGECSMQRAGDSFVSISQEPLHGAK